MWLRVLFQQEKKKWKVESQKKKNFPRRENWTRKKKKNPFLSGAPGNKGGVPGSTMKNGQLFFEKKRNKKGEPTVETVGGAAGRKK